MKYDSDKDYYSAIVSEIESQSRGDEARAAELRRDFSLERCMSRFDAKEVTVKGGFGVRTLVMPSPLTADIDVLLDMPQLRGLPKYRAYQVAAQYVIDAIIGEHEDRFQFVPSSHGQITDLRPDQAMGKIWVQVKVGEFSFSTMQIDFGIKPDDMPVEKHSGRDVLSFVGISNPAITTASREYLVADKISLVLEQSSERPRDLVHGALLLEEGKFDIDILAGWVEDLAKYRNVEAKLIAGLPDPLQDWIGQVDLITKRYRLDVSGQECYDRIKKTLAVLAGKKP